MTSSPEVTLDEVSKGFSPNFWMKTAMKRILNIFLLLVLLTSAQRTSQSSGQSANEAAKQSTAAIVYSQNPDANELFLKAREYLRKGRQDARRVRSREIEILYLKWK